MCFWIQDNDKEYGYNDTIKILEEIRDAHNDTASICISIKDSTEFMRYAQLTQIFEYPKRMAITIYYGLKPVVLWRRQQMKQSTLENMQIVDKEITDKQHLVLKSSNFRALLKFPETVDHLLFDYLDISIADLRDEELLLFLKKFLQTHKSMKRLKMAVPSVWGGLPLVWSTLAAQIQAVPEFSVTNSIGYTAARDTIKRVASDDNSITLVANIQSCTFFPLPLDNLIILYLRGVRVPDNEQKYLDHFKFGCSYKVIDAQDKIIHARDI